MNIVKRIAVTLLVLILTFSITGCGNVKEKTSERVSDKTSAEEKKDGKTFQAEDLVSMDEMSTITEFLLWIPSFGTMITWDCWERPILWKKTDMTDLI